LSRYQGDAIEDFRKGLEECKKAKEFFDKVDETLRNAPGPLIIKLQSNRRTNTYKGQNKGVDKWGLLDEYEEKLRNGENPNPLRYLIRYKGNREELRKELDIYALLHELSYTNEPAPPGLTERIQKKIHELIEQDKKKKSLEGNC
jgi:hypothetical protein